MDKRPESEKIYAHACTLMPGGVNSPARAFKNLELTPLIVTRGQGDRIWDVDGHSYIDLCCSWGSLILGHAHPAVVREASEQMGRGSSFGIATPYESECARKVLSHFPSMDTIRFVSSGTEATMSALRLARGYTGRSRIVKFDGHYHGHSDALLISAGSGVTHLPQSTSLGVPMDFLKYTVSLPFNDLEKGRAFLRTAEDIAAVIVEPVAANMGVVPGKRDFLQMLREETAKKGSLLIFDEVVTGFRIGLKGAQGEYAIAADLTCLGKIIGGGFPAAAFGGRKEVMEALAPLGNVYQAGTLSGNPVAMCAGIETLKQIERDGFYPALQEKVELLLAPIRQTIAERDLPACLQSAGSMFTLFFGPRRVETRSDLHSLDTTAFKRFFHHMLARGIYISPSPYEAHFLSSVHTEEHLLHVQKSILEFFDEPIPLFKNNNF